MSVKGAITKSLVALILWFCSLSGGPGRAQQTVGVADEIRLIRESAFRTSSLSEKRELKSKLKASAEGNVKILETENTPLAITQARARGLKLEGNYVSAGGRAPINDFVVELSVTLVNRESRRITGFSVEFANAQSNSVFYACRFKVDIGVNDDYELDIGFMTVSGDPSGLAIRLVGVEFDDKTVWGSFPLSPRNAPLRLSQPRSPSPPRPKSSDASVISSVDSQPRLLNNPIPRYTEQARRNRVMGTASVRALIGADGSVKMVRVLRALPDGLTEQALLAAYALNFEPARKDDQPVAFWKNVEIEFHLK